MANIDKSLIGAAGEHLVLSRLLTRGLLAAQAPRGVRKVDIIVNFLDGGEPFLIQVKTSSTGGGWPMNEKHESINDPDLFYCFVNIEPTHPTVHVVPAVEVAAVVRESHAVWLSTPGRNGREHRDTQMRQIHPVTPVRPTGWMDPYLENWDQLTRRQANRRATS
jgi:hypothetical protein